MISKIARVLVGFGLVISMSTSMAMAVSFDSNVPLEIKTQFEGDLAFMKTVSGAKVSPLHKEIFGALDGQAYADYFDRRVRAVGMNACGGGAAVACVIPFMDPSKMWLTQNFVKFSHPQIARLMVVYHEARHTESDRRNWPHATCPRPFLDENGQPMKSIWTGQPLAGEAACDSSQYGAYGSTVVLLKNFAKACDSCNEKVKADAALYSSDQIKRVTNVAAKKAILDDEQNL